MFLLFLYFPVRASMSLLIQKKQEFNYMLNLLLFFKQELYYLKRIGQDNKNK